MNKSNYYITTIRKGYLLRKSTFVVPQTNREQMRRILLMLLLITTLASCKKNDEPTANKDCKITSISEDFETSERASQFNIVYDQKGRVSRTQYIHDSRFEFITSYIEISYAAAEIQLDEKYSNQYDGIVEKGEYSTLYVMDKDGKIVSSSYKEEGTLYSKTTYTYSDGYLTRIKTTSPDYEEFIDISYSNGNVIKVHSYSDDGYSMGYEYSYNISEKYQPYTATMVGMFASMHESFEYARVLYEQGYFGKLPQNQMSNLVQIKSSGSVSSDTRTSLKYEKDALGKVITMSVTSESGTWDSTMTFSYDCQ